MDNNWNQVIEDLDRLEQNSSRIGELITSLVHDLEQTYSALEQLQRDLKKTKKQAATLRALSPRQYARTA